MIPYRKFSDTFKSGVGQPTPPKPPKTPKVVLASNIERKTLGDLGALGAEQSQTRNVEPLPDTWADTEEERAAIVEHDGGTPRAWAEGIARLDPNEPPGDVPLERWLRFIDDCGRFLDGLWPAKAADFGWGPSICLAAIGSGRSRGSIA